MEFESLSGKWITDESQEVWHRAQFFLDNHDTEVAYRAGNRYFTIQNTDGGYDYTFYDKAFHEIDGGVYDNPDVSIREAMDDILEDNGLSFEQCEVIDHGELMKFVEAVRIGDISIVAEEESDSIPLVSDHTEPEAALGGRSRAEVEETVLSLAQAELDEMGLSEDVKLLGARVYGSRTREGLYQEGSDVDVVLSYTGGIKESAFFNTLHESGLKIAGIPVDVNPISLEETGTLEDYLFRAEAYLDEKEAKMRAAKEAEKEPTISFYVAECSEFTNLGEYHDNLTLEEAVRIFDTIPPDRMSAIPCIGFFLSDGCMDDGEFPLMEAGEVLSDIINDIAHYRESPLVQQAIKDMQAILDERALQRGVIPVSHLNSYSEAKEAGEVDNWRASHRENERCAHEFSKDFGAAYHDRKMPEYLQKWVQKYGMERCKIVLASTIQLADYDGRYYPSTKEEAAKIVIPGADTQDTYKDRRQDYRVSTHPVMVNGAFRQLLAMEREQQEQAQTAARTQEKESAQPQSKAMASPEEKLSAQSQERVSAQPQEKAADYPKDKSVERTQKKAAAEQDAKAPSGSLLSRLQDKQKQVEAAKQTPGKTQDKKRGVEI
ncbi:MAG: DUF3849 domain-containing protein [Lachnospiraceae bacterium]|nr:DUF3849 domain-containing protein [Lachnospiraceae bacterium]